MSRNRQEFSKAIKVAVIKRSTRAGVVYCECCGDQAKRFQLDHVIADALGGKPVIENAELICEACYGIKNPIDTTLAAKAKRREAFHLGAKMPPARKLQGPPFQKVARAPRVTAKTDQLRAMREREFMEMNNG